MIKFCSSYALASEMDIQQTASRKTALIPYASNSEVVILFSAQVEPYNWIFYSRASQSFFSSYISVHVITLSMAFYDPAVNSLQQLILRFRSVPRYFIYVLQRHKCNIHDPNKSTVLCFGHRTK